MIVNQVEGLDFPAKRSAGSSKPRGLNFILQSADKDEANLMAQRNLPRGGWVSNWIYVQSPGLHGAISRVIGLCKIHHQPIQAIYLLAHGNPEGQEFGSDELAPAGIKGAVEAEKRDAEIQRLRAARGIKTRTSRASGSGPVEMMALRGHFVDDGTAELILGGCRVGSGDTAREMSLLLPDVLVSAFNMAQVPSPLGDSGVQYFYRNGGLVYVWPHVTLANIPSFFMTLAQMSTGH